MERVGTERSKVSNIIFKRSAKWSAMTRKFLGTKVKLKGSTAMQQMCVVTVDIPITKHILESLETKYQAWVATEEADNSDKAKSRSCQHEMKFFCIFKVFKKSGYNTHKKDSDADINKGGPGDNAWLVLEKIHFVDEEPFMRGKIYFKKDQNTWDWGGRLMDDNEIMVESKPQQPDLPLAGEPEGDDDDDGDGEEGSGTAPGVQGKLVDTEEDKPKTKKKRGKKGASNDDDDGE